MTSPGDLAAVYTRQSKGKERSISEQEDACRRACDELGWKVAEVYADRISASRFARGSRPDWARLIADLEAGRFAVLVMWESSRGDRDAETWMGLLRRCREHRVLIHVVAHDRTYDITRARDWKALAEDGIDSAYESERSSERLKRAMAANGKNGRPHGMVTYGYERVYDPATRQLTEQRPKPGQAEVVAEIIRRVALAEPLAAIARDLTARKVPTPRGAPEWERSTIRSIAMNVAYIGKRHWQGRDVDAMWPPLTDETTFYAARSYLSDPARKVTRPGRQKHLMSFLASCGVCGGPLTHYGPQSKRQAMYGCSAKGCVYISASHLDNYMTGRVVGLLNSPAVQRQMPDPGSPVAAARAEAEMLKARLDEYAVAAARGEVTARQLAIINAELAPQIEDAEKRAARTTMPLLDRQGITVDEFRSLPLGTRRELIRAAYTIKVGRKLRSGPGFDERRVKVTLRED